MLALAVALPALAAAAPFGGGGIVFVVESEARGRSLVALAAGSTSAVDRGWAPAWSPDGSRLAYLSPNDADRGRPWIRIRSLDGSVAHVEPPPWYADPPVWSPEGTRLAYVAHAGRVPGPYGVYVAGADGGSPPRLVADDAVNGERLPSWSPDGRLLAYTAGTQGRHATWTAMWIAVAEANGGGARPLTAVVRGADPSPSPQFSPDGSEVAFLQRAGDGRPLTVHAVAVADGATRQVSRLPVIAAAPRWSSDATRLLVAGGDPVADDDATLALLTDVYLLRRDGSGTERLTSRRLTHRFDPQVARDAVPDHPLTGTASLDPRWSPDGTRILFRRVVLDRREEGGGLYVMNADGTCETPLVRVESLTSRGEGLGAGFEWQPLPGAPPTPPLECADLGVEATLRHAAGTRSGPRTYVVRVTNDGTRPAQDVSLEGRGDPRLALAARTPRGPCTIRRGAVLCSLGTIAPRAGATVVVRLLTAGLGTRPPRFVVRSAPRDDAQAANDSAVLDGRVARCSPDAPPVGGRLAGSARGDVLCGGSGADRIFGLAGDDRIHAGSGDDVVVPGPGRDRVYGGPGDDAVNTADGEWDAVYCGPGRDRVVADRRDYVRGDCERVARR